MKARETELAYIYLFFDLIILNLSIVFMAWYSLDISLRNYHDISIYLFHGNLAWIITYFIFSKKICFCGIVSLTGLYVSPNGHCFF